MGVALRQRLCVDLRWPALLWKLLAGAGADGIGLRPDLEDIDREAVALVDAATITAAAAAAGVVVAAAPAQRAGASTPPPQVDAAAQLLWLVGQHPSMPALHDPAVLLPLWLQFPDGLAQLLVPPETAPAAPEAASAAASPSPIPTRGGEAATSSSSSWAAVAAAYGRLVVRARVAELEPAVAALRAGLGAVVPLSSLALLTAAELEELVCGSRTLNVSLLQRHARYEGGYTATSLPVQRLWTALAGLGPQAQASVVRFITGRSRLPGTEAGWQGLPPLVVARLARAHPDATLPQAHSCSFQLDLPEYSSAAACAAALVKAAELCACFDLDGGARGPAAGPD